LVRCLVLNNKELAKAYLEEASIRLRVAKQVLREGAYAFTIRLCQESVELALKAALRLVGVEPPKWHDVGPILIEHKDRYPKWFSELIDELAAISRWLRREREPSMYGDEELGLPPTKLYTRTYAQRAVNDAEKVFNAVRKLIEEYGS